MTFDEADVLRVRDGQRFTVADQVAVEEPLEIRLHGRRFAVIMRTPGADRDLAAGFLFAERVIRTVDEIGTIEQCRDADTEESGPRNVINVTLIGKAQDSLDSWLADRRHVAVNSSCGVCGRQTIEALRSDLPRVDSGLSVPGSAVPQLPERLRVDQPMFDVTGGLHAAGLFDLQLTLTTSAEDVGRHNAVDKVIGRMLVAESMPLTDQILFVSGRTSFEIIQKAWCASIPIVASVSAPSSLAIALAREAGITLVGFVRNGGFNVYAHPERIT